MARTQQQIREALENCTVAPREAAAAVISDAAKSRFEYRKKQEVDFTFTSDRHPPKTVTGSSRTQQ
jgi:hypothetical protein